MDDWITIYSVQNEKVWELLQNQEVVYPLPISAHDDFYNAYGWMYEQMRKRDLPLNLNNGGIFWGAIDKKETQYFTEGVLLTMEIPRSEMIFTDFQAWHFVLNNYPFKTTEEKDEDLFTEDEKVRSWEKIFGLSYEKNKIKLGKDLDIFNVGENGRRIQPVTQVCFTQIKRKWVKSTRYVKDSKF